MDVYFSVDVETDGPIPGKYSMLSLGAVAGTPNNSKRHYFSKNLVPLIGAMSHPDTMAWWNKSPKNRKAYEAATANPEPPSNVMNEFTTWVKAVLAEYGPDAKAVFVAYPAGFDFTFVYWYLEAFVGHSVFGFSALDMKSFSMALMGTDFKETAKRNMPKRWFSTKDHSHVAVDDAAEQLDLFFGMLKENRS